jgi:phage terminase large subunit-like protein
MVAPAALYMLSADKEGGAEVYSAAVSRDQARIVFNVAQAMAKREIAFLKRAGVRNYTSSIAQDKTSSLFQPLSADARSLDGLNVHLAILDELAQHKTREVHDVIETGTGKRKQPLMWMITTAGPNQGGIGFEIHDYAEKILSNVIQDDSFFTIIYTIDPGDDWTQPEIWEKANPNWGVSVMPETIKQLAQRATQVPSFQNAFQMKHLNVWTNAAVIWLDSVKWSTQALPLDEDEFIGEECMIGLDLASKIDIAAMVKVFRRPNLSEVSSKHPYKYFIIPTLYLPEAAVKNNRNANYEGWVLGGHIIQTPGEVIDFSRIEEDLEGDCKKFSVQDVPFDPWQATQFAQQMTNKGAPMIEFPATVRNFSEPTKEFEALVRQGLLFHNNNPAFNWMISNLVVKEDHKGNIFPRKERDENKIDGPVAAIMALARWVYQTPVITETSVYNDPNVKVFM